LDVSYAITKTFKTKKFWNVKFTTQGIYNHRLKEEVGWLGRMEIQSHLSFVKVFHTKEYSQGELFSLRKVKSKSQKVPILNLFHFFIYLKKILNTWMY